MTGISRDLMMELMGGLASKPQLPREELRRFLGGAGATGQHLNMGPYKAYLRRGIERPIEPGTTLKRPLELGSVERQGLTEAQQEAATKRQPAKFRNPKGRFRELLAMLEEEAKRSGHDSIYVENILNEFLPEVLASAGYQLPRQGYRSTVNPPSMYKRL